MNFSCNNLENLFKVLSNINSLVLLVIFVCNNRSWKGEGDRVMKRLNPNAASQRLIKQEKFTNRLLKFVAKHSSADRVSATASCSLVMNIFPYCSHDEQMDILKCVELLYKTCTKVYNESIDQGGMINESSRTNS